MTFNKPHPNSILATADPETRKLISARRREAAKDEKSIETWAASGFSSGMETMTPIYTTEE